MAGLDVEVIDAPNDGPRCQKCNAVIDWKGRGRKPLYCADHKPKSSSVAKTRSSGPSGSKAAPVVAKILIILTAVMAHRQCKRYGIVNDQLEDELTMSDDEADAIASPIARWSMRSKTGAKVLGPIVDNEDLIDAGVAIWEYNRRTSQILSNLRKVNSVANVQTKEPASAVNGYPSLSIPNVI